jgi:hypothetical protein
VPGLVAAVKVIVGHVLAWMTRKPYWAMHPDMDLDAMSANLAALASTRDQHP